MAPSFFVPPMKKTVGLTYDLKSDWAVNPGDPADALAELDTEKTVDAIASALESGGHRIKKIGNVNRLLSQIDDLDVDIVFNIAEGYVGRNRESQVPLILEMKGIPCVGADALSLGITLDKITAKKCFIADGIPTPRYFNATDKDDLRKLNTIGFPLIVKCRYEGSSKGLSRKSRVENLEELKEQVDLVNKIYKQSAIVEEFIRGTEFTVGVLGNEELESLPVVQVQLEGKLELGDDFYTFSRLQQPDLVVYVCPAKISKKLENQMRDIALEAYRSVDCRDFGRVDFRVDEKGNPYALEINPLPCLSREDVFYIAPKSMGVSYEEMINKILYHGMTRYGLTNGKHKEAKS